MLKGWEKFLILKKIIYTVVLFFMTINFYQSMSFFLFFSIMDTDYSLL